MTQKPYKCRVEYLESNGTQYIKTGVLPVNDMEFECKFTFTSLVSTNLTIVGSRDGEKRCQPIGVYNNKWSASIGGSYDANGTAVSANTPYIIKSTIINGQTITTNVNGSQVSTCTSTTGLPSQELYVFARNFYGNTDPADSKVNGRLYFLKIKANGVLVRDFIPVLDNNGRPAMYDNVSGQLFYNLGSGEFTYGRQIIPVEYLESSGTQYIDTGLKGKSGISAKTKVNYTYLSGTGSHAIGGEYESNTSCYFGMIRANGHFTYLYKTSVVETTTTLSTNTDYDIDITLNNGNQKFVINGNTVSTGTVSGDFTSTNNLFLYAINSVNGADVYGSLKMYYMQIWDEGTLVRDYIPCIDENNVPFMFDLVNCKIYENAGTGQFKVGANVEKSGNKNFLRKKLDMFLATLKKKRPYYCEVEYLESTGTQYIDISYTPKDTSGIRTIWSYANNNDAVIAGARKSTGSDNRWFIGHYSSGLYFGWNTLISTTATSIDTFYDCRLNLYNDRKAYINGEEKATIDTTLITTDMAQIKLFWVINAANKAVGKLKLCQITEGNKLIYDLIPVLDWNYTPCMYDKISGQLFYNAGTGNFSYGREIHYVDWLERPVTVGSNENMWINTGLNYFADFEVGVKLRESVSNTCMGTSPADRLERYNQENPYWRFTSTQSYVSNVSITEYHELKWKDGKVSCDGVELSTNTKNNAASTYPMVLFGIPVGQTVISYHNVIYFCKLWNPSDGTLVRDYLPAIDSNGIPFMFDRVTHTIYDNAGTGTFKYPAREVEYLQSSGTQYIDTGIKIDDTCGYDIKWMALNADDRIIMGTKGAGDSRWVLSGSNNPYVNISWNTPSGGAGLGLNKIQTAQMNYLNDRKRLLNGIEKTPITETLSSSASTYNVGIFAGYWGSSTVSLYSTCRIYYAKITKGTEFIRDFVPMIKDGSPCLFDKVGGIYYFGAGTGTFSVGKIVESRWF